LLSRKEVYCRNVQFTAVESQLTDTSAQGPGQLHTVFSPRNCLSVGGHFYTAATFHTSIDSIRLQLTKRVFENEPITDSNFDTLKMIVEHIDEPGLFTLTERKRIAGSISLLLSDLKASVRAAKKAEGKTGKQEFLVAADTWYRAFYGSQLGADPRECIVGA
jgi:hypothetical protein